MCAEIHPAPRCVLQEQHKAPATLLFINSGPCGCDGQTLHRLGTALQRLSSFCPAFVSFFGRLCGAHWFLSYIWICYGKLLLWHSDVLFFSTTCSFAAKDQFCLSLSTVIILSMLYTVSAVAPSESHSIAVQFDHIALFLMWHDRLQLFNRRKWHILLLTWTQWASTWKAAKLSSC